MKTIVALLRTAFAADVDMPQICRCISGVLPDLCVGFKWTNLSMRSSALMECARSHESDHGTSWLPSKGGRKAAADDSCSNVLLAAAPSCWLGQGLVRRW